MHDAPLLGSCLAADETFVLIPMRVNVQQLLRLAVILAALLLTAAVIAARAGRWLGLGTAAITLAVIGVFTAAKLLKAGQAR